MAYRRDNQLRGDGEELVMTPVNEEEYQKCKEDLMYFIQNYMYINTKDHGNQLFKPRKKQSDLLYMLQRERFVKGDWYRQAGFTTTVLAYMLWKIVFFPGTIAVYSANKKDVAYEKFNTVVREAYRMLPYWMQPGLREWTDKGIYLSNGSWFKACTASTANWRGHHIDILFIDEFGYLRDGVAQDILASYIPTVRASAKSCLVTGSSQRFGKHTAANTMFWDNCNLKFALSEYIWCAKDGNDREWEAKQRVYLGDARFDEYYIGKGTTPSGFEKMDSIPDMSRNNRWKVIFHSLHGDWQKLTGNMMIRSVRTEPVLLGGKEYPGMRIECINLDGLFVDSLDLRGLVNVDLEMYNWKDGTPVNRTRYKCLHLECLSRTGPVTYAETHKDDTRLITTQLLLIVMDRAACSEKCTIDENISQTDESGVPIYRDDLMTYLDEHVLFV